MKPGLLKKESVFILVAISLVILVLGSLLFLKPKDQANLNIGSNEAASLRIERTEPAADTLLKQGDNVEFTILFNQPINSGQFNISLEKTEITKDASARIEVNTNLSSDNKTLNIVSREKVQAFTNYHLLLSDNSGKTLYDNLYLGETPLSPTEINNNQDLKSFLPYETDNYILSYSQATNRYIFNFKFDINNPESASAQFDNAQEEAKKFIQSKQIDLESIVIEWRHR